MPRSAICSAVWILMFFFRLVVTENKTYLEQNVHLSDSRENRLAHDSSESYRKQRPSRRNESNEIVKFSNKILRLRAAKNYEGRYKNASLNKRTLMDYNGPIIMEDLDDTSNQDLTSHIRVKRNEPIVHRRLSRSIKLIDLFQQNSQSKTDATSIFSDSISEESRSDHENRSGTIMDTVASRLRRKRGVLFKNGYRKKRMKGSAEHSKHHVEIKNGNKKHDALRSSHQSAKEKTNNLSSKERKKNIREIDRSARTIDKSEIEKRESGNTDLNTINIDTVNVEKPEYLINQKKDISLLMNNRSLAEQQKENTVILPFVHTGRAELRVLIEKLPANKSSLSSNYWTNCSVGTSPCSIMLPKYNASDEIFDVNVTNFELAPYSDSIERRKVNNLTVEITLKNVDHENTSVLSNIQSGIEDERNTENGNYDRTNEMPEWSSDEKSRAKRNQEITSKRYLRSNKNAKDLRHFKDIEQETSIGDMKRGKMRYRGTRGNRAVRSIEEIKDLAEKLIVKIHELEIYVSNRNETLHARDSCLVKNGAVDGAVKPRNSVGKDVSSSTFKIAKNVKNRQRFAKKAAVAGKNASRMHSGGSRFARGEYRTRRKWGRWMDWSSCSVTCGKGRQIRWRHCLHDCNDAETEMEEKACQLPACPPSKFLGIF